MKKIMFNDRYGLTQAVINGTKIQTRRIVSNKLIEKYDDIDMLYIDFLKPCYDVGDIVAVSQSYHDLFMENKINTADVMDKLRDHAGWSNKLFVKADLMPYQIKITSVRGERLQDITYADILQEGVKRSTITLCGGTKDTEFGFHDYIKDACACSENTKRAAFTSLIDKISGKGTWGSNPFVWVYEFELINNKNV